MLEAQFVSPVLGGTYKSSDIAKVQQDQEHNIYIIVRLSDSSISKYAHTATPGRSTVQSVRKALAVTSERFTTPSISKEGDIVTLNETMNITS